MVENRPIVAIAIGYIIGIITGLYCKISIAFLYLIIFCIYLFIKGVQSKEFKLLAPRRYLRYIRIIATKKVVVIIVVISIISNTILIYKDSKYNMIQNKYDGKEINIQAIVKSNLKESKYVDVYKIKIETNGDLKNKQLYLYTNKSKRFNYGDMINLKGIFNKPKSRSNYRGFDYKEYLKTKNIYGIIKAEETKNIKTKRFQPLKIFNDLFLKVQDKIRTNFEKDVSGILLGLILGYTDEIDDDIIENFSNSNILHILAVSGMHISYIIIFCKIIFKTVIGKRKNDIITIFVLVFYMILTGLSPSVVRAGIMAILVLMSKVIYKKSDIWTNLSISILILLIYNPFFIQNIGLILSYVGTIGVIIYSKIAKEKNIFKSLIGITIAVSIFIAPILGLYFNKIPILSVLISPIIGFIIAPILILTFLFLILSYNNFTLELLKGIISGIVKILLRLSEFGSNIPFNKIYIVTPNIVSILFYYSMIIEILFLFLVFSSKRKTAFNRRMRNVISLFKYRFNQNRNRIISIILLFTIIFSIIKFIPKNLKINFIDVGQGDSCLIFTPKNQKILIDGGGAENYDIGKNILLPYLLDRKVKILDYVIISHFDTDHIGGLLTVMGELKVDTVIISKQGETSENYERFIQIVKEKNIKVVVVGQGDRLKIEKDLYFDILWPNNEKLISENVLNNNSTVCKLVYRDFSMLFTGDIEEIAEKQILKEYKNNLQILKSNVLKVAHHGSKTSSTEEFIDAVKPKIALIGVGKDNKFGHPNDGVLERLKNLRY